MQQLTIAGVVGKNSELRSTQSGEKVLNFSVAVSNGKDQNGNYRDSDWYDVSVWGKRGEALQWITKGMRVCVAGRPTARAHEGKAYMGLNAYQVTPLGGGEQRQEGAQHREAPRQDIPDDEIPF